MKWSDEEIATFKHLAANGLSDREIGAKLNRSRESVRCFRRDASMSEAVRLAKRRRRNELERARNVKTNPSRRAKLLVYGERAIDKPSADILRERDRRLAIPPRDLSAAFFGDPLPGFSALERRT